MYRFDDTFDVDPVGCVFTGRQTTRSPVTRERMVRRMLQRWSCHPRIRHRHAYQTADNDTFRRLAKQVVIVVGLLRSRFQAALVVGLDAALLAFGELILLNRTGSVALMGQNLYDTHLFLDEYSHARRWKIA